MWKWGIAFIRGLNVYGKNRIKQRDLMRVLKELEADNLRIVGVLNTDDIIFETTDKDFTSVGAQIERKLKKVFKKNIYVTTRSYDTILKLNTKITRLQRNKRLFDFTKPPVVKIRKPKQISHKISRSQRSLFSASSG